jgi:hypothetical protein
MYKHLRLLLTPFYFFSGFTVYLIHHRNANIRFSNILMISIFVIVSLLFCFLGLMNGRFAFLREAKRDQKD